MSVSSAHSRVAALARAHPDTHPALVAARLDLRAELLIARVRRELAIVPPFTPAQLEKLSTALLEAWNAQVRRDPDPQVAASILVTQLSARS